MTSTFPPALLSQHIAIVGKTGSGKTYTAKGFVEQLLNEKRRVCILDPTGVWYGLRSSPDGKRPGYPIAVFGGRHADVPIAENSGPALAKIVAEKNLPAIIDLSEMLIGQRHRFMTDFAEAVYRDNRAPLHLVIDEADEFAPQNPLPETKRMLHHVDRIVRRGRVRGFRVMLITQRPAVLHKNVLTQANALIAMRLTAPQDRKAMQAWVEGQADANQAKEVLGSLARLQRGEGWVWAPELDLLQRTAFPRITTFDSGRTPEDDEKVVEPTKLAAVDLGEVRASFDAVEQEIRSLKDLTVEVTKLRKELASAQAAKAVAKVAKPGSAVAAPAPGPTSSMTDAALRAELAAVTRSRDGLQLVLNGWHDRARKVAKMMLESVGDVALGTKAPDKLAAAVVRHEVRQQHTRPPAGAAPAPGPVSEGITAPQQRILDVLAQLETLSVPTPPRGTVAVFADASPSSSAYGNNLGRLRTMGLIDYPSGGRVALTPAGEAKANAPTRPATMEDLHEAWCRQVTAPQAAILRALIAVYPESTGRDGLAATVGASAASSAYGNNLGHLRTLGAIEYPQKGAVRASAILFPKGRGNG